MTSQDHGGEAVGSHGLPGGEETGQRLGREDWLAVARAALIRSGHSEIKIGPLATDLGVTRGSFYWHFRNRDDLLQALMTDWEVTNSRAILHALDRPAPAMDRFRALAKVWLEETDYSPAYDSAMRDWARVAPDVKALVERVDDTRIEAFSTLFLDAGHSADEAFIRARITYFHQVGYYAMGVRESRATRQRFLGLYMRVLMGR